MISYPTEVLLLTRSSLLISSRIDLISNPKSQIQVAIEEAEEAVFFKCQNLRTRLNLFSPHDIDENYIKEGDSEYKKKLGNIKEVFREVDKDLKRFLYRYTNAKTNEKRDYWKQQEASIFNEVKSHEKQVRAAVSRVKASSPALQLFLKSQLHQKLLEG